MKKQAEPEENLVKLFGSVSRARILAFLYAFSGRSFYQREIVFETGLALRAVQRELNNLAALGVVKTERTRSRVYYEINSKSRLFKPLGEICIGFQAGHSPGSSGK
jgi:predicted transcriptional regulator